MASTTENDIRAPLREADESEKLRYLAGYPVDEGSSCVGCSAQLQSGSDLCSIHYDAVGEKAEELSERGLMSFVHLGYIHSR
jgi:hypothetical protein